MAYGLGTVLTAVTLGWPGINRSVGVAAASLAITLLLTWAELAVSVRRLHDLGKTGWLLLLCIVPIAGLIILIWLFGRRGDPGDNRFGSARQAARRRGNM